MKTSASDVDPYKNICRLFVANEGAFSKFRNYSRNYNRILEHVSPELGQRYLSEITKKIGRNSDLFALARENDNVGSPLVYDYGDYGMFSPTTLRYLKVLIDIEVSFGVNINGDTRIVEIGGGYGGQCRLIKDYFHIKNYAMIDLPEVIALQQKYLSNFGIDEGMLFCSESIVLKDWGADLVISNFAFDELFLEVQAEYYKNIIKNTPMGYVSGNWHYNECYPPDMFGKEMNATIREYTPNVDRVCYTVEWNNN